ncbi:MAG TPA: hypothetical protein VG095_01775, partial [Chthoniobacterales bacterium]|nr:hypothetical protein [Chthoniobacterales bacterium]
GTVDVGAASDGVFITGNDNEVGSLNPAGRNLISGNGDQGIDCGGGDRNRILGNFIGTDVTGTQALPNGTEGIAFTLLAEQNEVIGNLISGNANDGVSMIGSATNSASTPRQTLIRGNIIGANVTGTAALPNGASGIFIQNSPLNTIGGTGLGEGNLIAFNTQDGVEMIDNAQAGSGVFTIGNAVRASAIHSNGQLGIDLGNDGVTPNDPGDIDASPNRFQNFPVLTSAAANTKLISGALNTESNRTYRIEFFANAGCDPLGHGEGTSFLGATSVTTTGSGNASVHFVSPAALAAGAFITATATDADGNTSEFSPCRSVSSGSNDSDGDGMSDEFEQHFFGHPTNGDPTADPDGDGLTNVGEFITGLHPLDSQSRLQLTIERTAQSVVLRTPSVPGRLYTVEVATTLPNFTEPPLVQDVPGTGGMLEFTDAIGAAQKHYRVIVELAP